MRCQQRKVFKPFARVKEIESGSTGQVSEVYDYNTVIVQFPGSIKEKIYCNAQKELSVKAA